MNLGSSVSLGEKPYYFITDRSTKYRYLVDNTSSAVRRFIFYPQKYETMTSRQIKKYEHSLVPKLIWWACWNKQKMRGIDWQICKSKAIDIVIASIITLLLARSTRVYLFRHQFISFQTLLETKNYDVKFCKALIAYAFSFTFGYNYIKSMVPQLHLIDLAYQYGPNYLPQYKNKDSSHLEVDKVFKQLYLERFPWLRQQQEKIQKQ